MQRDDISNRSEQAVTIVDKADVTVESDLPRLDERETLWLSHYIDCGFNATLAARRAFHYERPETAEYVGWQIKHRPHVQVRIKAALVDMGASKERIAANLLAIANADWSDMVQVKMRNGLVVDARMDLNSTVKANELIGRELGMFNEKIDHTVEVVQKRLIGVDIAKLRGEKLDDDDGAGSGEGR